MGQLNGKGQKPVEENKDDNNALTAELDKGKDENEGLEKRQSKAEERAQMAKKELVKISMTTRQKEETTSSSGGLEITQNSLDRHRRVPLPLELNCQIFECLKFGIQRKFIGGLGRGIYGMFRQKVLTKDRKKLALKSLEEKYLKENAELEAKNRDRKGNFAKGITNLKEQLKEKINWNQVDLVMGKKVVDSPIANAKWNRWDLTKTENSSISISADGCNATINNSNAIGWQSVVAERGFIIPVDFPGPLLYYFELGIDNRASTYRRILVGLSSGNVPDYACVGELPNSYAIRDGYGHYLLSGKLCPFEWPNGTIKPIFNPSYCSRISDVNVIGCGLLVNPGNELALFFTGNGLLMGKPIPINSTVNLLYPTVSMFGCASVEANFGDSPASFKYDIKKCPGMVFKGK